MLGHCRGKFKKALGLKSKLLATEDHIIAEATSKDSIGGHFSIDVLVNGHAL